MLHSENRQSGEKSHIAIVLATIILITAAAFHSCSSADSSIPTREDIIEKALTSQHFAEKLESLRVNDGDTCQLGHEIRQLLSKCDADRQPLWVDRAGATDQARRLLPLMRETALANGLGTDFLQTDSIRLFITDLDSLKATDYASIADVNSDGPTPAADSLIANLALRCATLEHLLTQGYLKLCTALAFGIADPYRLLGEACYGTKSLRPDHDFAERALEAAADDKAADFIADVAPRSKLYRKLSDGIDTLCGDALRLRQLNLERLRWHRNRTMNDGDRWVFVNVAARQLWARNADSTLQMRVVCGTTSTRTPLLESRISSIQVNPVWNIPYNIVKTDIMGHAGDSAYFTRHRYYVTDDDSERLINPATVTAAQFASGHYHVKQEGGPGNSLGRLKFNFPNPYSVYLHDTSNKPAFQQERRLLSHGCVRVQHPLDLALLLLDYPDEWTADRMRIAIGQQPLGERGKKWLAETERTDEEKMQLSRYAKVEQVPVAIDYFTLLPDPITGEGLNTWPDVYGYDKILWRAIKPFATSAVKEQK